MANAISTIDISIQSDVDDGSDRNCNDQYIHARGCRRHHIPALPQTILITTVLRGKCPQPKHWNVSVGDNLKEYRQNVRYVLDTYIEMKESLSLANNNRHNDVKL